MTEPCYCLQATYCHYPANSSVEQGNGCLAVFRGVTVVSPVAFHVVTAAAPANVDLQVDQIR